MTKTYKSDAMAAIHETVSDLHEIGQADKRTLNDQQQNERDQAQCDSF
jgi:DNA-binding transcriptional regulator YiaG